MVPCATAPGREYRDWAPGVHTVPLDQRLRGDPVVSFYQAGTRFRDSDRISVPTLPGDHLEPAPTPACIADVGKSLHCQYADAAGIERSGPPPVAGQAQHTGGVRLGRLYTHTQHAGREE